MLMITSFANPRVVQAFVDYMATLGVILTIQQNNQSNIWLVDDISGQTRAGRAGVVYGKSRQSALSGGRLAVWED